MAMDQEMVDVLNQENQPPWVGQLLQKTKNLVELSRKSMQAKYEDWDYADKVYRGEVVPNEEDKKANERNEPTRFAIPLTYAQTETFVAFMMAVMFQREYFFELTPYSVESTRAEKVGEGILQRDLDYNKFIARCRQFFTDMGRFGLAVYKEYWTEQMQLTKVVEQPQMTEFLGTQIPVGGGESWQMLPKYQGNIIENISPYRWFPDPRVDIQHFQDGEFVASEREVTYIQLKEAESRAESAGVKYLSALPKIVGDGIANARASMSRMVNLYLSDTMKPFSEVSGTGVETEVQIKLIPAEFLLDGKVTPMGDEDYPVKFVVTYVNDQRVTRIERLSYDHDQFTYSAAQFSPDIHHFLNFGLSEILAAMQDVVSWFVNSHITSVRKVIQNWLVADTDAVDVTDLKARRSVVRMIPGKNRLGIDAYLKQLQVSDVTSSHMQDAGLLQQQSQLTTGISDNALGQFHGGRRSATEAKNVNAATASRLKMIASITYYDAFEPLGRRMLSNLRQGLSVETYVKIFGMVKDPTLDAYYEFAKIKSDDLVGDYDFEIYDGTLPSEKIYTAQALQEVLAIILPNPQMAMFLGLDPKAVLYEMLVLRGVRHPERFSLNEAQRKAIMLQMMQQQQQQQANGQPGEEAGAQPAANGANAAAA